VPQRATADTEFGRQLALGRKLVAFGERILGDERQQCVGLDGFGLSLGFGHLGWVRIDRLALLQYPIVYYSGAGIYSAING
jgi:hypothetical protein